jgi:hypothetical protein
MAQDRIELQTRRHVPIETTAKAHDAVHNWPSFAKRAGLRDANIKKISKLHTRL